MKKSDLKSGMVVVINNNKYVLIEDKFVNDIGFMELESYDESLKFKYFSDSGNWDITKVYSAPNWGLGFTNRLESLCASKLLWDRKREINWQKVPMGTKVKVKTIECGKEIWKNRYFVGVSKLTNKLVVSMISRDDDFTGVEMNDIRISGVFAFEDVKIHPLIKIEEKWYK